ncbi:restriction endonuclease subunit S [Lysinibacillus sp. CTST325]
MKNNHTPEIRFPGFTGDWEQRKLGDLVIDVSRPLKMVDDDIYQLVTVKRRNGGIVSRGIYKGSEVLVKSQFIIKTGDYLISKRQVVHGANGIVPEYLDGSIVSNEYLVLHGTKDLNIEFFSLISELPSMYKNYFLSSYGIDIEKLVFNVPDWKKRRISIPSIPEQDQITSFIKVMNNAIALQQQELITLEQTKQGFLQKMFPTEEESVPKVRFPGFTGDWEQCRLKDLGEIKTGSTPSTVDADNYSGDGMIWVTPSDIVNRVTTVTAKKLSKKGQLKARIVEPGTILVTSIASIGKNTMVEEFASFNQQINSLTPSNENDSYFLLTQSDFWSRKMKNIAASGTMQIVNKNDFSNISVLVPKKEEQIKIGNFFKQFDNSIALQHLELNALKETKKAFLQKMFA